MENQKASKIDVIIQAVKFGIVGAGGTVTNLLFFFIFSDKLGLNPTLTSIICFAIAVTQNYILNHLWTFGDSDESKRLSFGSYIKFIGVCLFGLIINLSVLNLVLYLWASIPLNTIAQAFGILTGMVFNFIGSKFIVFGKKAAVEK